MPFSIPDAELRHRASRSRGPGGQHVNKASTRVEVVWNVEASTVLTGPQRERLREKLRHRIDRRGMLRVASDRYRSQLRNREDAAQRLREIVDRALRMPKPRKKTKPPPAATERRLDEKRRRADRKAQRRPVKDDE